MDEGGGICAPKLGSFPDFKFLTLPGFRTVRLTSVDSLG